MVALELPTRSCAFVKLKSPPRHSCALRDSKTGKEVYPEVTGDLPDAPGSKWNTAVLVTRKRQPWTGCAYEDFQNGADARPNAEEQHDDFF